MTGRMELEAKYANNINRLLENEPEYMKHFNVFMAADNKTAKTRQNYINNVLRFVHYLNDTGSLMETEDDFKKLTMNDIRSYIQIDDDRVINERGVISDSYKYLKHFSLNCFFNYLEDGGYITKNPMLKIKTPKNDRLNKKLYLDVDEVKEIEKNVKNGNTNKSKTYLDQWRERDEAIIVLGFETGLRVSAIVSINLDDINWQEKYINTIEKGNRPRRVYLNKKTTKAIENWIKKRNEYINQNGFDTQALFVTNKNRRISSGTIGEILRAYAVNISNKEKIHPHTMRSSMANILYKKTCDVEAVRVGLGHRNISTTQKYMEDSIERQKAIANINLYGDDDE